MTSSGKAASPRRASPASSTVKIGLKLRQLRRLKRLRLKELADRIGVSESLLSKVENDKANPSAATLDKLVKALDSSIDYLLAVDESIIGPIAHQGERPIINSATYGRGIGIKMERLIPYSKEHLLQANIHIVEPGGRTHGPIRHRGEEVGLVLEGELDLKIGRRTYPLKEGDSFHFQSDLPHSYRNTGDTIARIVWVNTPPAYYMQPVSRTKSS